MSKRRSRPNWVTYDGGPLHGTREMLNPARHPGARIGRLVPARNGDGPPLVHEYIVTETKRPRSGYEGTSLVARYVGLGERLSSLDAEREPALVVTPTPSGASTARRTGAIAPLDSESRI